MAAPAPIPGGQRPDSIRGPKSTSQVEKRGDAAVGGVAFRALLDKLEVQAQDLKTQADGVEGSDELAGAVGSAQQSLEQALEISNQLVEAFRQSLQQVSEEKPDDGRLTSEDKVK